MNDSSLMPIFVLLGTIIANRFIAERGFATLQPDEKVRVMDAFAAQRKYTLLVVIALVGLSVVFAGRLGPIVLVVFGLYPLGALVYAVAKMRRLGLPQTYVRYYSAGQTIQICGLAVYLAGIRYGLMD